MKSAVAKMSRLIRQKSLESYTTIHKTLVGWTELFHFESNLSLFILLICWTWNKLENKHGSEDKFKPIQVNQKYLIFQIISSS